jgi:hypothetical protein
MSCITAGVAADDDDDSVAAAIPILPLAFSPLEQAVDADCVVSMYSLNFNSSLSGSLG